jgi:hypothetical protein
VVVRPASLSEHEAAARVDERAQRTVRLQVTADRLLQDWKAAHDRAHAYLAALGVARGEGALADAAVAARRRGHGSPAATRSTRRFRAVRELLREGGADAKDGATSPGASTASTPGSTPSGGRTASSARRRRSRAGAWCTSPSSGACSRGSSAGVGAGSRARHDPPPSAPPAPRRAAVGAAPRWRRLLVALVLLPAIIASGFMVNVLPYQGRTWLEVAIAVVFGALFGWISIGFWTAMLGFWVLLRGGDRFDITRADPEHIDGAPTPADEPRRDGPDTAIIMPICAEPVERVFAGLRALWASLERTGGGDRFHLYVLSDTADPALAIAEEAAWADWCRG